MTKSKSSLTKVSFFQFLFLVAQQGLASAEGYRSGVLRRQRSEGTEPWAADDDVVRACKGVRVLGRVGAVDKGTLTEPMFAAFFKWLGEKGLIQLQNAAALAYFASLRINELKLIRVGDLQDAPTEEEALGCPFILTLRMSKRADAAAPQIEYKPVDAQTARVFGVCAAAVSNVVGAWLFPRSLDVALRAALVEAAKALGWPVDLDYSGTHVLRNAGSKRISKRIEGILAAFFSQQTAPQFAEYARSNSERKRRRVD